MQPVAKALWFIESNFDNDITLADVAQVAGVSRFHMLRAFGLTTGHSVMRYVRARRLTEAAKTLANGAPDILTVALDAGYASHEAFTRAFGDQFGLTPDALRAQAKLDDLLLVEAYRMDDTTKLTPQTPRIEDGRTLLIAGLSERYSFTTLAALPALWQRFREHTGHVPGQVDRISYGVCYNTDDSGFDYLAGVEVGDLGSLPNDLARLRVAAQRYAVFTHTDHVSTVRATFVAIFNHWLPQSGHQVADAPVFERYDERFDPHAGTGGFQIWVPIRI
ncbi:AraC family transcriptional regulator [Rhodopila sp.]|uniref:AraC family transcriptional regulator n=1 Tax=Rhodopila sp. TaxID=2480087 RepID=UPI003D104CA1